MAKKKKVYHLNIFLLKDAYKTSASALKVDSCGPPASIAIAGHGEGQLFIKRTPPNPPRWADLFKEYIDSNALAVPGVAAAFFILINDRSFVLAFGQGGRHLLREDVFEERFGLMCALNAVDPKSFRCVDVQSLDAIESHTRIQSGQETTPDQFGLSVEQDMLKAIVGTPKNAALGNRMTGSDALSVSVKADLSDLPFLLNEYRKMFEAELSDEDYQWVHNIAETKSAEIKAQLEKTLNARLLSDHLDGIWLSIPEIIDWTAVAGFMFSHGDKVVYPDINLKRFCNTVDEPLTLDLMRTREVHCADADHKRVFKSWSVFKCLYAEVDFNGSTYVLNDGKWFSVAKDFVARTDQDYASIPRSKLALPRYSGGGEGAYNAAVAATDPTTYDLLDKKLIRHGGGHGQIEVCDLFTNSRELIHVKLYGKSSVLSHLFSQGFVSGQLVRIDAEFRQKVRDRLATTHRKLIEVKKAPLTDEFTIVYAVISEAAGATLNLPFFSKVNLNNTRKILKGYGYKVEVLKIGVDDAYAKTQKVPPKKAKK